MNDPVSELEERPGVLSWMRKNARIAIWTGVGLTTSGVLLSFLMFVREMYQLISVAVAMISGGPSLIAIALGAKAWQAQAESRGGVYESLPSERGPVEPPEGA